MPGNPTFDLAWTKSDARSDWGRRYKLVSSPDQLPTVPKDAILFADCETVSAAGVHKGGLDPWIGDRACSWALTWDGEPTVWYVPIRHRGDPRSMGNLSPELVARWMDEQFRRAGRWCNHNVKFDVHMAHADGVDPIGPGRLPLLECTMVMSRLVDSDEMGHSLEHAAGRRLGAEHRKADGPVQAWLEQIRLPGNAKAKCYAAVPPHVLGPYACRDVDLVRGIRPQLLRAMTEGDQTTWLLERELTTHLARMERRGLPVDRRQLLVERARSVKRLLELDRLLWPDGRGGSDEDARHMVQNVFGLRPKLLTESGKVSLSKEAIGDLILMADKPDQRAWLEALAEQRREKTFLGLFVDAYLELSAASGEIHPRYNQVLRTGRMAASRPNAQQLSARAKRLVPAQPGHRWRTWDASQIEYRMMAVQTGSQRLLATWADNPRADFHQARADEAGIDRRPAKTLNFSIGYGAGETKAIGMLVRLGLEPSAARRLFHNYHRQFPELRKASDNATSMARRAGGIRNVYGRGRRLPRQVAHIAFNTLCQGMAADHVKRKLLALCKAGVAPWITVHDSFDYHVADSDADELARVVEPILTEPDPVVPVPIVWDLEDHEQTWGGELDEQLRRILGRQAVKDVGVAPLPGAETVHGEGDGLDSFDAEGGDEAFEGVA